VSERFDAVVIGSGFGGSVTAARLAEAGRSVLVLERGRPYPPGSFPRSPAQLSRAFWDPPAGRHGMFDVWSFTGVNAVTASGLGGGSLIYANVLLRKPRATFVREDGEPWPVTYDDLAPHYERVEQVIDPRPYPPEHEAVTPKTRAMRAAAQALGREWESSPLAVAFAGADGPALGAPLPDDPHNVHGVPRTTCRLCGECDLGCNFGAKQTLDHTYLSRASAAGATIRTLCEATVIVPRDGGYAVTYRQHLAAREGVRPALLHPSEEPVVTVDARRVIVAAGTIGTARLLLRNRLSLPRLSPRLGEGFSSNGDLLTFAWRGPRDIDMSTGPVITGTIRWDDDASPSGRMFQVQDAGVPALGEWLFHAFDVPATTWAMRRLMLRWVRRRLRGDRDTSISSELSALIGRGAVSSGTLPLLGMGRDIPGGRLFLSGEDLDCDWDQRDSEAVFDAIVDASRDIARELGAQLRRVPLAHLVTVHPLGGCSIAHEARDGVVDTATGEAFGHPGLHVADGSLMPGPVGPNPSLTIAALADRFAGAMIGAPA
jgi:cholesterol oxidase